MDTHGTLMFVAEQYGTNPTDKGGYVAFEPVSGLTKLLVFNNSILLDFDNDAPPQFVAKLVDYMNTWGLDYEHRMSGDHLFIAGDE